MKNQSIVAAAAAFIAMFFAVSWVLSIATALVVVFALLAIGVSTYIGVPMVIDCLTRLKRSRQLKAMGGLESKAKLEKQRSFVTRLLNEDRAGLKRLEQYLVSKEIYLSYGDDPSLQALLTKPIGPHAQDTWETKNTVSNFALELLFELESDKWEDPAFRKLFKTIDHIMTALSTSNSQPPRLDDTHGKLLTSKTQSLDTLSFNTKQPHEPSFWATNNNRHDITGNEQQDDNWVPAFRNLHSQ